MSPPDIRSFITIAVDESATRHPVNTPVRQSTPKSARTPVTSRTTNTTWSPPPTKMRRLMRASLSRLNSIPMVKSRRMTPSSAADSISTSS
jgi:hypothetical protein